MKLLNLVQGSAEWRAMRVRYRCASEAAAMMGVSKHMKRDELLRLKQSGDEKEFTAWAQQNLLDKGHEVEAKARVIVETMLGEELFPATVVSNDDRLLASMDGLTMDSRTGFECKLWNEELAAMVRKGELSPHYYWQLEHQLKTGDGELERIIFTVSDGTEERTVWMEYTATNGRAQQLLAGWKQFDEDLKNYVHVEDPVKPVAEPVMALPSVSIQVNGAISLISNLDIFGSKLKAFVEGINREPSTDQDFANAEAAVKTLQTAQDALDAAENAALAQTASIDEMRRTVAMYRDLSRDTRLMLEKLVKARKDAIRGEIAAGAARSFADHVASLNIRIGKSYMPHVPTDFVGVMRGKKTIASLRDAVNTELARCKIAANEIADRIDINLKALREFSGLENDFGFLFSDMAQIVTKDAADFALLFKSRIAEHHAKEQARLDAERERIRAEEQAKVIVVPQGSLSDRPADRVNAGTQAPAAPAGSTPYEQGYAILQDFVARFGKVKEFSRVVGAIAILKQPKQRKAA